LFVGVGVSSLESLGGLIFVAAFIYTWGSSETKVGPWQGEKISGDLFGPIVRMLEHLVFETMTESYALVFVDEEDVARVENEVVDVDRLFQFYDLGNLHLSGHLPLSTDSHRMVAGDQQVSRQFK